MEKDSYRPRLIIILVLAIVIGQMLAFNYLKRDFESKLDQCYDAINTSSVMQGALVNLLIKKNVMERDELLNEVQTLSADLKEMVDRIKEGEGRQAESGMQEPLPPRAE